MAWQEQGSLTHHSLEEWVSEGKEAPKAEPEEDIEILEPGAEVSSLQENQEISIITIIDATIMELARNTQSKPEEFTQNISRQTKTTEEEPEECVDLCDDEFPPPPSSDSDQICEIKAFSSFECNLAEPTGEAEVILDPMQVDITSQSGENVQECRNVPELTEPFEEVDTFFNEIMADEATAEEHVTQMNVLSENLFYSQSESLSGPPHHSISNPNTNSSDNMNPGDNGQEENEVSSGFVFCQQQLGKQDVCNNNSQPPQYLSTSEEPKSTQHANPSVQQQEEQLLQSQNELAPGGENQETAQQVFGLGSPPLSNVAMELSNQGGAASYNSDCVAAVREGHGKAEGRTEEGNVQTGEGTRQGEEGFENNEPTTQEGEGLLSYSQTEKYRCGVSHEKESHTRNDSWDNSQSDNGVSTDFFSFCPVEDGTCTSTGMTAAISKETPIEREIRRHLEREHSLRRARGLPSPPTSPLYVEIPLPRNGPGQLLASKAEQNHNKDREFAGKMMQHEIHGEIQREQDLVKLGKVPGVYDKGTVRQIKERKHIFEAFQTPSDSTLSTPTKSKASSWSSDSQVSSRENQGNSPAQASPMEGSSVGRKQSQDLFSPTLSSSCARGERLTKPARRGPGFSEGAGFQVIILENDMTVPAQKSFMGRPEAQPNNAVNTGKIYIPSFREDEEEDEKPKENPFFKLRSSNTFVKVKQDIQETEEREKELRNQRLSLYRGIKGGDGKATAIQKEEKTLISSISPINGQNTSDPPGLAFSSGPPTAHHSVGSSNLRLPANVEERKMTCPEGLQSSCSRSQKTPLVQRWESGMLNGHNKEDE